MLLVGLTGNYGMGKSTVLNMFRDLGAITVESDELVGALLGEESVLNKIREAFGDDVFTQDGRLNREKVASLIFSDKNIRDVLEEILHPLVIEEIEDLLRNIDERKGEEKVVIIEIPLMFEKGFAERFHKKVTVYTDEDVAFGRLERSGINKDDAIRRLKAQMPIGEKIRMADFTINNNGALERTKEQVIEVYNKLLEVKDGRHQRD